MVVIDTFEDGDLTEYVGDTDSFTVKTDSNTAFQGSNYLEHSSTGEDLIVNNSFTLSYENFPINFYFQVPSSGSIGFTTVADGNETTYSDFVGVYVKLTTTEMIRVNKDSGSTSTFTIVSASNSDYNGNTGLSANIWYRMRLLIDEDENRLNISIFETGNSPNKFLAYNSDYLFEQNPNKFAIYGNQ